MLYRCGCCASYARQHSKSTMRTKRVINFLRGPYEGMLDANFPDVLGVFVTYLFEIPLNQKFHHR